VKDMNDTAVARECLATELGRERVDEILSPLDRHLARQEPVVVVCGAYDAGKTSLLKRLLVEDGKDVPAWLRISGGRETFEIAELGLFGASFVDTPGLSTDRWDHTAIANSAILLSDAVLLLMPPQLLTSERDEVLVLLSGERFACPTNAFAAESVVLCISRIDEVGIDPGLDPTRFTELVDAKFKELRRSLSPRVDGAATALHAVSADPWQLVSNDPVSSQAAYGANRSWDGIEGLVVRLRGLPGRLPELRWFTERRFLSSVLDAAADGLEKSAREAELAAEASEQRVEHARTLLKRLAAFDSSARATLGALIADELSTATRRAAADEATLERIIGQRLAEGLNRWRTEQEDELAALAREAEQELKVAARRASGATYSKFFEGLSERPPEQAPGRSPKWALAKRVQEQVAEGIKIWGEHSLGMTMKDARRELTKLDEAGGLADYLKEHGKRAKLRSPGAVKDAEAFVAGSAIIAGAIPVLIEFGQLAYEASQESNMAKARIERRRVLRERVEQAGRELTDMEWKNWLTDSRGLRDEFQTQADGHGRKSVSLRDHASDLMQKGSRLRAALAALQAAKPPA